MNDSDQAAQAPPPSPSPTPSTAGSPAPTPKSERGPIGLFIGWVLVPLLVAGALIASGVHQAAHNPDAWFTKAIRALSDLH